MEDLHTSMANLKRVGSSQNASRTTVTNTAIIRVLIRTADPKNCNRRIGKDLLPL